MSEKTPRLRPHERTTPGHFDIPATNRYVRQYEQKLGQMSLTDGVPIPTEAPEVKQMDIEAERPGNTWNWSRDGDAGPRDTAEVMEIIDNGPDDIPPIAA